MRSVRMCRPVILFTIFLISLLIFGIGCQQRSDAIMDPAAAKELCTRLWTDYLESLKSVQPDKVAGCFTKDAVLIYPDMAELKTRDSIQAFVAKVISGVKYLELTFTLNHFDVVGSKAYTFVTLTERVEEGGQAQPTYQSRCGAIWQRQADSTWQISHYLINYAKL
jgi:ketosteroid isomerase-like protein